MRAWQKLHDVGRAGISRAAMLGVSVLAVAAAVGFGLPSTAGADTLEQHVVTPRDEAYGTTIDLFDYWLSDNDADRFNSDISENQYNQIDPADLNRGINKFGTDTTAWPSPAMNGRQLIFSRGLTLTEAVNGRQPWSSYTGKDGVNVNTGAVTGMVSRKLGADGYPILQTNESIGLNHDESLAYLFSQEKLAGKQPYGNVKGLLNVDDDGYYYYDSSKNFAEFDEASNRFTIYDAPAVVKQGAVPTGQSNIGQFFPFNTGATVFESENGNYATENGKLKADQYFYSQYYARNGATANHYFGLTMSTRFQQPADGEVTDSEGQKHDMTYHFSGDDDVWVYIDDVLVGDLGGIHAAESLDINFASGEINQNGTATTIAQAFSDAGAYDASDFTGNTFKDGTYHTLKFFYLERGNWDSNMELRFNLMTVPTSDVIKVDQNGNVLPNVGFSLYAVSSSTAEVSAGATPLATGTTDREGTLVLEDDEGKPISFDELYSTESMQYYVLRETNPPSGYSKLVNEIRLKYEKDPNNETRGALIQDPKYDDPNSSVWKTGSFAMPKEIVSAKNGGVTSLDGSTSYDYNTLSSGVTFPMVFVKRVDGWHAVYGGNQVDGWQVSENAIDDPADMGAFIAGNEAARAEVAASRFKIKPSGALESQLEDLPGSIEDYAYWQSGNAMADQDTKYAVAFYYSSADSAEGVNANNTVRLNPDGFNHSFSLKLYVSNIRNEIYVQKVDENGKPVSGAQFALYEAAADGSFNPDAEPVGTVTTANLDKAAGDVISLAGGAVFGATGPQAHAGSYADVPIDAGGTGESDPKVYYIKEISTGNDNKYVLNETVTKVIVDNLGVYADAGNVDDGVKVIRGVGNLVRTLSTFAAGRTNNTLRWLTSAPGMLAVGSDNRVTFGPWDWSTSNAATLQIGTFKTGADATNAQVAGVPYLSTANKDSKTLLDYMESEGSSLSYGPYGGEASGNNTIFATDAGWLVLSTSQYRPNPLPTGQDGVDFTNLSGQRLSALITGSAIVQVTNKFQQPGDLVIKKVVTLPNGQEPAEGSASAKQEFDFTLTVSNGGAAVAGGLVKQEDGSWKYDANATEAGDGTLVFDQNGIVSFKLKHGESITVKDLPIGSSYTVTEAKADGFATTVDREGATSDTAGTHVSGTVVPANATITYTNARQRGLKIFKTDENGDRLAGSAFALTPTGKDQQTVTKPLDQEGKNPSTDSKYQGKDGYYARYDIASGESYTVEETTVPAGYQKLADAGTFVVGRDGKSATYNGDADVKTDADGDFYLIVENRKIPQIPQTGGSGTASWHLMGLVLMAGAGAYLMRRRMEGSAS